MSRNTKMRLLIGVAVILESELVGFVANFIMVLMARTESPAVAR